MDTTQNNSTQTTDPAPVAPGQGESTQSQAPVTDSSQATDMPLAQTPPPSEPEGLAVTQPVSEPVTEPVQAPAATDPTPVTPTTPEPAPVQPVEPSPASTEQQPETPPLVVDPPQPSIPQATPPQPATTPPMPPNDGQKPPTQTAPGAKGNSHSHGIYFMVAVITLVIGLVFGYLIHSAMTQSSTRVAGASTKKMWPKQAMISLPKSATLIQACVSGKGAIYGMSSSSQGTGPWYIVNNGKVIGFEYSASSDQLSVNPIQNLSGDGIKVDHVDISETPATGSGKTAQTNYLVDLYTVPQSTLSTITCQTTTPTAPPVTPTISAAQTSTTPALTVTPTAPATPAVTGQANPGGPNIPAASGTPVSPTP